MTLRAADVLRAAVLRLKPMIGDDAARDARVLLADALGIEMGRLTLILPDEISPEKQMIFQDFVIKRMARKPVSQIIGKRMFWGRDFFVNGDVLDPRPETETLINLALQGKQPDRLLDLGLGSGCILLTLLLEMDLPIGVGVDISDAAIAIAQKNANSLSLASRAKISRSDWFSEVDGQFDLIVSNPPYISYAEMAKLQPEVAKWEPKLALTPGCDGLGAYRIIATGLDQYLAPNGRALFEIGRDQGPGVCAIFQAAGFGDVQLHSDLSMFDRVVDVKR